MAELAVVIDEDLGVGRELHAEAAADERGVAAEGDAGRGEGASRHADERGREALRGVEEFVVPAEAKLRNERAIFSPSAMREVRRTPSVVWKEFSRPRSPKARRSRPSRRSPRMRVHIVQGRVRRDADIRACGGQPPMVSRLRMALIALARGRRGRVARKAERREKARGAKSLKLATALPKRIPRPARPAGVNAALIRIHIGARAVLEARRRRDISRGDTRHDIVVEAPIDAGDEGRGAVDVISGRGAGSRGAAE